MELLDLLETSEVITIGTATANGKVITTPVGVVVVGDAGYVRSQHGAKAKWYQRVLRTPGGFVVDGDLRYPVIFEPVTDAETIRQADAATLHKYGGALRSLILRPLLWRTKQHLVKITPVSDYPTAANTESG